MCIFQKHFFLCGCDKLKISSACSDTSVNAQRQKFCRKDPHPHIDDGAERMYNTPSHGFGVCSNIHCRWRWSLAPTGVYEPRDKPQDKRSLRENDASFDMSEDARSDREARWFRLLSADRQLECLSMTFPLRAEKMSLYAQAYFCQDSMHSADILFSRFFDLSTAQLHWSELNPRYMNAEQLRHATGALLPASVTIPGNATNRGSTPHQPLEGPFKVATHNCKPKPGVCRKCGRNAGDPKLLVKQANIEAENMLFWTERPRRPHETDEGFQKILQGMQNAQEAAAAEGVALNVLKTPTCQEDVFTLPLHMLHGDHERDPLDQVSDEMDIN